MLSLIKQVFIILLSFSESLATTCLLLNDEPFMVRPTHTDLNPVELKYYLLMISLDTVYAVEVAMSYLQIHVFQKKQKT